MPPRSKQKYYINIAQKHLSYATILLDLLDDYRSSAFPPIVYEKMPKETITQAGIYLLQPVVTMMLAATTRLPRNHPLLGKIDAVILRFEEYEQAAKQ